jgi:hypothetical protein
MQATPAPSRRRSAVPSTPLTAAVKRACSARGALTPPALAALLVACVRAPEGTARMIRALLRAGALDGPSPDCALGHSALHAAAARGRPALVAALLASRRHCGGLGSAVGRTPLHLAAAGCHAACVRLLLRAGVRAGARCGLGLTAVDAVDVLQDGDACRPGRFVAVRAALAEGGARASSPTKFVTWTRD